MLMVGVMKEHLGAFAGICRSPKEGAEDDGILKSLALVNGRQEDCVLVALEPELMIICCRPRLVASLAQPAADSLGGLAVAPFRLHVITPKDAGNW